MARVVRLTTDQLAERMRMLEAGFNMTAREFFDRYRAGELGDSIDVIRWAGLWHMAARAGLLTPQATHA